jgi:hypothetical protein
VEAISTSETSVNFYQTKHPRRHLHTHRHENLKPHSELERTEHEAAAAVVVVGSTTMQSRRPLGLTEEIHDKL